MSSPIDVSFSLEQFKEEDTDTKLNLLFGAVVHQTEILTNHIDYTKERLEKGNERFKKLENRKRINTAASFGGGVIGGIIAIVGKNLFGIGR